ncbi:SDR family oxidoreductase [Arthrobacter sp.]|uniref:SDR family oxidoreductase n=1 Tax=Arthrobacter sp. TaxID=1667 RepID=UPI002811EFF1|nr:SDR family oxidoreductase [Arthrobacter sp.]
MKSGRTLNVLVTGGSGASGVATAMALRRAGFRVLTVGSDKQRIVAAAAQAGEGVTPLVCDLANLAEVQALHSDVTTAHGGIDGVIHLVGGWRGANGITTQTDEDWDFLERNAVTTLRNVSRVFYNDLSASDTGRFAMVSSTAVTSPTAATANYVAAKAAAEVWTMAMAQGFETDKDENEGLRSAAVVFVVKAFVDDAMREKAPERKFPGFTDVRDLGAAAVDLFQTNAHELNGQKLLLVP